MKSNAPAPRGQPFEADGDAVPGDHVLALKHSVTAAAVGDVDQLAVLDVASARLGVAAEITA